MKAKQERVIWDQRPRLGPGRCWGFSGIERRAPVHLVWCGVDVLVTAATSVLDNRLTWFLKLTYMGHFVICSQIKARFSFEKARLSLHGRHTHPFVTCRGCRKVHKMLGSAVPKLCPIYLEARSGFPPELPSWVHLGRVVGYPCS